jgi:hypothetical protein
VTPLFQPNQLHPHNPHLYHPNQGAKVQPTGQHTKTPHTATGLFALLRGLIRAGGSGAPPRLTNRTGDGKIRLGNLLIVKQLDYCLGKLICHRLGFALSAALLTLSFGVTTAEAAVTHKYEPVPSKEITAGVPSGTKVGPEPALTGLLTGVQAMAADSGHLYVAEKVEGTATFRTDAFNGVTGAFELQFEQVPGLPQPDQGVAVAHASHDVYVAGSEGIAVFSEAGVLRGIWRAAGLGGGGVAVDNNLSSFEDWAAGDVYAPNQPEHAVDLFKPGIKGAKGVEEAPEAAGPPLTGTCPSTGKTVGGTECAAGVEEVPFASPLAVAVSQSTGEVLVLDQREREGGGLVDVVDVFKPVKPLALGEFVFVRQLTGTPNGGAWESPGGSPVLHGVAAGAGGDIYVSEGTRVDQFNAEGVYQGRLSETPAGPFPGHVAGVAVDQASGGVYVGTSLSEGNTTKGAVDVFGRDLVIPDVTTEPVSGFQIELETHTWAATLNGTVNPIEGAGAATCEFEWGLSLSYGEHAPCSAGVPEGAVPVEVHSEQVTKLQPDTTYDYRLDATNEADKATTIGECPLDCASFTTPGPGIQSESASAVASTSVTLEASIDPHEEPAAPLVHPTAYFFEYGETAAYGKVSPTVTIGPGESTVAVAPHVQGLAPGKEYHYRVVAVSEVAVKTGEVKSEKFDGPDHTFTTQSPGGAFSLLDGRQWELVSPPDKHGALIEQIGTKGEGLIQASVDGTAVTYTADAPTEGGVQGYDNKVQVFSTRGGGGWSTRDIVIPHENATGFAFGEGVGSEYRFFSEDLSLGIVQPFGGFSPAVSPEASEQTAYLRSDYTGGSVCVEGCYRPLLTSRPPNADVTSGLPFSTRGECPSEEHNEPTSVLCGPRVYGATPDASHMVLSSHVALTTEPGDEGGLYEWTASLPPSQRLSLVSRLPNGEDAGFGTILGHHPLAGARIARHAVSAGGGRVFFTVAGGLFMRDVLRGETIEIGGAGAAFEDANAEGSRVFFSGQECEVKLNKEPTPKLECEVVAKDGPVLGASEDGTSVYFESGAVLTGSEVNGHGETAQSGQPNLYVSRGGTTKLIAVLSPDDSSDWNEDEGTGLEELTSRVSPDGGWLAFLSDRSLTGYDTRDAHTGLPDEEVYLYSAVSGAVVCASCDPSGARPEGPSSVPGWTGPDEELALYQSRYLSDRGRVFFNSDDALVPLDVNGAEDVYSFEPLGVGGCTSASSSGSVLFTAAAGGCVGLISSGSSPEASTFLDASESGGDVFFLTTSKLSPRDLDTSRDVYDAHECSAVSPCLPQGVVQPPACTTADSCRSAPAPQPEVFGSPSSATFSGAGNLAASPSKVTKKTVKCSRGKRLSRKRCVKRKKTTKARKAGHDRGVE